MYLLEAKDEFDAVRPEDMWVYNKLQLSSMLGYKCGPLGVPVPESNY